MKGATAVSSATTLVPRHPIQQWLLWNCLLLKNCYTCAAYHTPKLASTALEDHLHIEVYITRCGCVAITICRVHVPIFFILTNTTRCMQLVCRNSMKGVNLSKPILETNFKAVYHPRTIIFFFIKVDFQRLPVIHKS